MAGSKQIYGYYPTTPEWLPVKVDASGRLVIDASLLFENPPTNGEAGKAAQSDWSYDHWKDPYAHQDTGGKCGITLTTLTGNVTLTPRTETIHQWLNPNGTTRTVTLATSGAVAGDIFVVKNTDAYTSTADLLVYQATTNIDYISPCSVKRYIFNGTDWKGEDFATGTASADTLNVAIGYTARSYGGGFAMGSIAYASGEGIAIGKNANAQDQGVSIGTNSVGRNYGLGIGYGADNGNILLAQAIGYYSKCTRTAETTVNIEGSGTAVANSVQGRYYRATSNNTPVEMGLAGISSRRFTIKASSALAFRITVAARDNVAGHVAMYTFEGVIKRDASNNTVLSVGNKVVVHEDDATWDCDVTADDTNEALIITVTGDGTNPTRWAAVLEGTEVIFA